MEATRGFLRKGEKAWALYLRWAKGEFDLVDPSPPRSLLGYLLRPDHSMWLYVAMLIVLILISLVELTERIPLLYPLRYVFGAVFVLFLPGYSIVEALYPNERDLSPLERLALSIGLSLAVVPLLGLFLNYTPWGIRLRPVLVSLTVFIVLMLTVAAYRKLRLLATRVKTLEPP